MSLFVLFVPLVTSFENIPKGNVYRSNCFSSDPVGDSLYI